ncbi:MAG: PrsW family intramembrane metalloprotease [Clostridiales bacterium]|nr:MAG: PrsW family intramembrane metalloprotease [Clostridiales bacterium]
MLYNIEKYIYMSCSSFLIAALGTNAGNRKNYLFIVLGFVCCIISAYLNTFFSVLYNAQDTSAVLEISPVIEETVKLLPLLFGLIVFELQPKEGGNIIFNIAVGFATFENVCYLLENGTGNLFLSVCPRLFIGRYAHYLRLYNRIRTQSIPSPRRIKGGRYFRTVMRCDYLSCNV